MSTLAEENNVEQKKNLKTLDRLYSRVPVAKEWYRQTPPPYSRGRGLEERVYRFLLKSSYTVKGLSLHNITPSL